MTVDFSFRRAPKYRVAIIRGRVPWTDSTLRSAFRKLVKWARSQGLPTGKWIVLSRSDQYWEACLEIRRPVRGSGSIHVRVLPATTVASITFDPEVISPRVIYHGIQDWLKWRRKAKEIRSVGFTRELYSGDPWTDRTAWSRVTVEYAVRK